MPGGPKPRLGFGRSQIVPSKKYKRHLKRKLAEAAKEAAEDAITQSKANPTVKKGKKGPREPKVVANANQNRFAVLMPKRKAEKRKAESPQPCSD